MLLTSNPEGAGLIVTDQGDTAGIVLVLAGKHLASTLQSINGSDGVGKTGESLPKNAHSVPMDSLLASSTDTAFFVREEFKITA